MAPGVPQNLKTRILHQVRNIFKVPAAEKWLVERSQGISMKNFLYKLIPHNYTYLYPTFRTFNKGGVKLRADISDFLGHGLYFGYDNEEERSYQKLLSLVKSDFVCIDAGANIGYLSLRMGQHAKEGTVIGFEPDPVNYQRASENLALNSLSNVFIHNLGLGSENGEVSMEIRSEHNLGGNRIGKPGANGRVVPITTIDFFFNEVSLRIDLIKIDVEGYEWKMLQGARKILERDHPILFIEIDDDNLRNYDSTPLNIISYLIELGYKHFENAWTNTPVSINTNLEGVHFDLLVRK